MKVKLVSSPEPDSIQSAPGDGPLADRAPVEHTDEPQSRVGSSLTSMMREASVVPLLTREEEVQLAARIKEGDDSAREHMIRANLRLVIKIARDYENLGLPLADLISEGTIGLMKAVDRFDPAKGGKLSTYGALWIKQQIRRALANQSRTIRLPVHVESKIYRLGLAELKLREELGREATEEELSSELNVSTRRVARLKRQALRTSSLDAPVGEESDGVVADFVSDDRLEAPDRLFEQKSDHSILRQRLDCLPEREAEILRSRFGLNGHQELTLEELGERYNLTRERIRQLQNEAFAKLRYMLENVTDSPLWDGCEGTVKETN